MDHNKKHQTYAITHRPIGGVSESDISVLVSWCKKHCRYYKVITEKEGSERHIHAACFLSESKDRSNVVKSIMRLYPDLLPEEKMVLRQGIKVSGNSQWLDYLEKGDSTVIIESNLPELSHLDSYYPPPPELPKTIRKNLSYYGRLEKLWYEHVDPSRVQNPVNCRHFLFNMMYNKRLIDVIRDDKTIIQTSRHLARYLNRVRESSIEKIVDNAFEDDA